MEVLRDSLVGLTVEVMNWVKYEYVTELITIQRTNGKGLSIILGISLSSDIGIKNRITDTEFSRINNWLIHIKRHCNWSNGSPSQT